MSDINCAHEFHKVHKDHDHKHGAGCGHTAIEHDDHVDFVHEGHLHHEHEGHNHTHDCNIKDDGTSQCGADFLEACGAHDNGEICSPTCGHEAVPHGNHTDYLVPLGEDSEIIELHCPHNDHCDDHGWVFKANLSGPQP